MMKKQRNSIYCFDEKKPTTMANGFNGFLPSLGDRWRRSEEWPLAIRRTGRREILLQMDQIMDLLESMRKDAEPKHKPYEDYDEDEEEKIATALGARAATHLHLNS